MVEFKHDPEAETLERLARWIQVDPYHKDQTAQMWLYPNAVIASWIYDKEGPVMYFAIENEEDILRLHTQFAPQREVGRLRLAKAMLEAWPKIVSVMKESGAKGIAFLSVSPSLIEFMKRQGFQEWKENDYLLEFL